MSRAHARKARFHHLLLPLLLGGCAATPQPPARQEAPAPLRAPIPVVHCPSPQPGSAFEQALLQEINLARSAPRHYAELVRQAFSDMDDQGIYPRNGGWIQSHEGPAAIREAVSFLHQVPPQPPLHLVSCLSRAAADHASDLGWRGAMGHRGRDGSTPSLRARRHLQGQALCTENISYGVISPRDVVIQLLVDDGVPSRGHRRNLFFAGLQTLGVAQERHRRHQHLTVMLLCRNPLQATNFSLYPGSNRLKNQA